MQNPKDTLEYICTILSSFGIDHPNSEEMRQSKFDKAGQVTLQKYMTCLFELTILYLCNFKINFQQLQAITMEKEKNEEAIKNFLLLFFKKINCPFIMGANEMIIIRQGSSRYMLLLLGWLLEYVDLFQKYDEINLKKFSNIFEDMKNSKVISPDIKKKFPSEKESHPTICNTEDQIIVNFNILNHNIEKISKLLSFRNNKWNTLNNMVKADNNSSLSLEDIILLNDQEYIESLLERFEIVKKDIEYQIINLRSREVFWSWMESVIDLDRKELADHEDYGFDDIDLDTVLNKPNLEDSFSSIEDIFKDFNEISEKLVRYKNDFASFLQIWNNQSQMLQSEKYKKISVRFKENLIRILPDLEQKYPSIQSLKEQSLIMNEDCFLGEIFSHIKEYTEKDIKPNNIKENESLIEELGRIEEKFAKTKEDVCEILKKYFLICTDTLGLEIYPNKLFE